MRLCLDTSAYSNLRRNHPPAVALIRRARWVGLPAVVLGELRCGFLAGDRADDNEAALRAFMSRPVVHVLEVDELASQIYAEICLELRRAGTPVPTNDAWIAAVAAREGASVLTYDPHFQRIQRVGCRVIDE